MCNINYVCAKFHESMPLLGEYCLFQNLKYYRERCNNHELKSWTYHRPMNLELVQEVTKALLHVHKGLLSCFLYVFKYVLPFIHGILDFTQCICTGAL